MLMIIVSSCPVSQHGAAASLRCFWRTYEFGIRQAVWRWFRVAVHRTQPSSPRCYPKTAARTRSADALAKTIVELIDRCRGVEVDTRDAARIGERRELRQPRRAHWRLRVSADDMNDAIEFEDAQGSGVHLEEEWSYRRQGNRQL